MTKTLEIEPFANNSQSIQIGNLIIENQTDKITLYGDIDIFKNTQGLEYSQTLLDLMEKIVANLKALPEEQLQNNIAEKDIDNISSMDNPFL